MGVLRRFFDRLKESDEARLAAEIRGWAENVPGTTRIADAPLREPVKLAGVVRRITVFPVEGQETLEALLYDGTGDANIVFMGRRGIQGMTLGTKVVVEGVLGDKRGEVRMVNPRFEFGS
jgi:RecG-like helicase